MPTKKKYNARFAPARIKKIMQTDEEVGKVSAAVPVLISKALEMFLDDMMKKADLLTKSRSAKTLTVKHLKQCILEEKKFDFLHDTVATIPDLGPEEEEEESKEKQPRKRRKQTDKSNGKKESQSSSEQFSVTEQLSEEESEGQAPDNVFTTLISNQTCERGHPTNNGPSTSQSSSNVLISNKTLERSKSETNTKPAHIKPGVRSFSIDSIMATTPFPNLPAHKTESSEYDEDYDA